MSTKAEVLRDSNSCLNKASHHEPIFVLRAKDPHAAQAIRLWAAMSDDQPVEKLEEAYNVAAAFEEWYHTNVPKGTAAVAGAQQAKYNPAYEQGLGAPVFLRKS